MPDNWVFLVGLVEILLESVICLLVLKRQLKTFKAKTELQPIKRLLFSSVILIIIAHLPLTFVYADTLWWHFTSISIVYAAVLSNSTSMILVATLLYLVYKGSDG